MAQPMPKRIECDGRHKSNNDQTCLNRRSNHGDKGDEDGAEDIDDGEDQIDLEKGEHVQSTFKSVPYCGNKIKNQPWSAFPIPGVSI